MTKTPKTISELMGREWFENYCDAIYDEPYKATAKKPGSYEDVLHFIREAVIAKALGIMKKLDTPKVVRDWNGKETKVFVDSPWFNGEGRLYEDPAVFDKLQIITGDDLVKLTANRKNAKRFYTAMWGYDQTNITTAEHIGKFNGFDVVIFGGFSSFEIHLVRINNNPDKYTRFSVGCERFTGEAMTKAEATKEYETKDDWAAHKWAR